jgi:hypothetical protein
MVHSRRVSLAAVAAAAIAARVALALAIAPFQAPDEAAHLRYVETLGRTGRLPVQPQARWPDWEQFYQPPLAYATFVPAERVLARAGAPQDRRLRALRIVNAVLGSAMALVAYAIVGRLVPPGDWRPLLAALVVALFPGFAGNASVLNNDTLANLLAAVLWIPLVSPGGGTLRAGAVAGAIFGAACLAKLSVLALAPLLVLVPAVLVPGDTGGAVRRGAVAGVVAATVMLPWMVRNYAIYGNALAIGVGSVSFASLTPVLPAEAVAALARPRPERALLQFWGQFGIYNNLHADVILYVLLPLVVLALAGWLWRAGPADTDRRFTRAALAALLAVGLAAAGLVAFSLRYHAAWQGRYLYTTVVPAAMLLAGGWHRAVPPRLRVAFVVLLATALLVLDGLLAYRLQHFYATAAPSRWPFSAAL